MPGADVVRTEYDGADRPLFVQTGEQRKYNESTFHIYDLFGRECLTGTCSYNIPSPEHSLYMTSIPYCTYTGADNVYMGYELHGLDPSNVHVLTANYYDDYGFTEGHDELLYSSEEGFGKRFNKAKGLLTGRATACLSKTSNDVSYLYEAIYYDFRQRVIQKKSTNYLKGTDSHYYTYDFSGNEILHRHVHASHIQPRLSTVTLETSSTYDHAGRLMKQTHSVNGNTPVTIKDLEYDGLCRLKSYSRNGNDKLGMEYSYNVRSWLTGLGGPLISMSMGYENSEGGSPSCYSGNQSSFQWRINSSGEGISRRYNYSYDGLSRLASALYADDSDLHHANYDTFYDYDRNGNILSLRRNGKYVGDICGTIDDLFYEYDGNRLRRVTDAAEGPCYKGAMHFTDGADEETEYDYDSNGNLIEDKNKGISKITYNEINLPEHVSFSSGKYIDFTYSSTGEKLCSEYLLKFPHIHEPLISPLSSDVYVSVNNRDDFGEPIYPGLRDSLTLHPDSLIVEEEYMMIYGTHRIDYCGDIIYENIKPVPNRILFDGGYVTFSNKQPVYHFYLTDHQGNVRVVADAQGNIEQTNNYYPFGALFGDGTGDDVQRYKYNGKELDRLLALDCYDYGARWYDPVLARWHAVDPLAEKYPDISPYVYCLNNPVNAIDPDGKRVWVFATFLPNNFSININPDYTPTHTFVVVQTSRGKIHRFEYGPQGDPLSGFSTLRQFYYDKSGHAVDNYMKGIHDNSIKNVIEVDIPNGMTKDEFDKSVINSAAEFSDNTEMKYRIIPIGETEGNCNTSTTSLLKNAGVSDKEIKRIGSEIKGIKTGFGTYKSWTDEERQRAIGKREKERRMSESLSNNIGF